MCSSKYYRYHRRNGGDIRIWGEQDALVLDDRQRHRRRASVPAAGVQRRWPEDQHDVYVHRHRFGKNWKRELSDDHVQIVLY